MQKYNNTLESFLIDDVFHCFNKFIQEEKLMVEQNDIICILKAFANYVGIWCHQCTDQYREISYFRKIKDSVKKIISKNNNLFKLTLFIYLQFYCIINKNVRKKSLRTRVIDKYILNQNLHNNSNC